MSNSGSVSIVRNSSKEDVDHFLNHNNKKLKNNVIEITSQRQDNINGDCYLSGGLEKKINEDAPIKQCMKSSSKMNQGPTARKANWGYQVEGSVHVRLHSSQMFKLIVISFTVLLGLGCLVVLRLNALETRINNLQEELLAIKQLVPDGADGLSTSTTFGSDNDEDGSDLGSEDNHQRSHSNLGPEEKELSSGTSSVIRRRRREVFSEIIASSNNSNSSSNQSSSSLESFEITNSTITSSMELVRLSRHYKIPGGGVGRRSSGATSRFRDRGNSRTNQKHEKLRKRLDKANLRRIADKGKRLVMKERLDTANKYAHKLEAELLVQAQKSDIRAVHLRPSAQYINIDKAGQYIGPWHIASDEKEIGFNGLWYKDVGLDTNGTSIIFNENGLYSFTAQVCYQLSAVKKDSSIPMGYRIYIRKGSTSKFKQPFAIAECVAAYPFTYYQTCLTGTTWYLEKGDQIFLQHFKNSLPIIEADEQGKTFLQIVKLGG